MGTSARQPEWASPPLAMVELSPFTPNSNGGETNPPIHAWGTPSSQGEQVPPLRMHGLV